MHASHAPAERSSITRAEFDQLRKSLQQARRALLLLGGGVAALGLAAFSAPRAAKPVADVLTVRGLIVVDSLGRERILLGAPLRAVSSNRRLGNAEGMVVMDSLGRMQTAVGYDNPLVLTGDRIGTRMGASTGLTFYDPRTGAERGGMGAFGDGRANACLDYDQKNKEAVCMSVAAKDAYAAVLVNGTPGEPTFDRIAMFAGQDGRGTIKVFGGRENQGGVMLRAGQGVPSVTLYDSTGKPMPNDTRTPNR
jgi:hypothetical protein